MSLYGRDMVKIKVPSVCASFNVPPCISIMFLAIDRPNPAPAWMPSLLREKSTL